MNSTKEKNVNAITEGIIWQQLLIYFFPLMLGSFFQLMYNTADTIIVGRFLGKEALSAVGGSSGRIIDVLVYFIVGICAGASAIISQLYGAKNYTQTHRAVHTAICFAIIFGIFASALGIVLTPSALRAIATPADVFDESVTYLRIYFMGVIPSLLYNMGASVLRAVGDSKRPFIFLILTCFLNVILDVVFIVYFNMGVAGAAFATVLAQTVSAVLILITLLRAEGCYRLYISNIKIHKISLRECSG